MTAPAAIPDTQALRSCWHPVAFADDVGNKPVGAKLLDEPVVVWRGAEGRLHAVKDLCIHRGTALSLGGLGRPDRVPLPRLAVRGDGVCASDPAARGPDEGAGQGARRRVPCQERYGLIWVALDAPRYDAARHPRARGPAGSWSAGPYAWNCDASRQLENFTDFGHFPWVHPGLLGDPERPVVPDHTVRPMGTSCTTRSCAPRRPTATTSRSSATRDQAPERRSALPAAPALHDPAAARLGRREGDGLLLRLPAGRRRHCAAT